MPSHKPDAFQLPRLSWNQSSRPSDECTASNWQRCPYRQLVPALTATNVHKAFRVHPAAGSQPHALRAAVRCSSLSCLSHVQTEQQLVQVVACSAALPAVSTPSLIHHPAAVLSRLLFLALQHKLYLT